MRLEIRGLYHPLLEEPVKNDILAKQGILVTGSNASGKSTFLKAVALNALLAQTIPVSYTHLDVYKRQLCIHKIYTKTFS